MQHERTEDPTPRRRERARAHGHTARSALLPVALCLIGSYPVASALQHYAIHWPTQFAVSTHLAAASGSADKPLPLLTYLQPLVAVQAWTVLLTAWLICVVANVTSVAASGALHPSLAVLTPRITRLSWSSGFRRLISIENVIQAAVAVVVISSAALALGPPIGAHMLQQNWLKGFSQQAAAAIKLLTLLWARLTAMLLAYGLIELMLQRRRAELRLRMSPREVRDDRAETEAKPEVKQQRRAVGAKRSRNLRLAAIKQATAIIANPSHVAVALRYAPPAIDVPLVVARAADRLAAVVKEVAAAHDIPVIESADLARRLYAAVDVDEPIPEEYYAAVAAVFAWIVRTRGALAGSEGPA